MAIIRRVPTFGELLRRHRVAAELTQEALAERAGLSVRGIQKLEAGESRPYRDTAARLAAALGLLADDRGQFVAAAQPTPRSRHPERVVQLLPAATLRASLPTPLTSFIGRERELAEVARLLSEARLVTLTGPPGSGKSRLALAVAHAVADRYADAAGFVSLASVGNPDLVLSTIASALGLRESGARSASEILMDALANRELLLVLDNFEQIVAAAPVVTEVLEACPGLRVLATSRIRLDVRGERQYVVPPLSLPAPRADFLASVASAEAVRLFVERVQAVNANFRLSDENAGPVAEICRRLDGLPLAIELAAPRIRHLAPEAMLARLKEALGAMRLLSGGPRDLPARQQTLRDTIAWSYGLLDERERSLLRSLGVFAGGCTLAAAEAVCAGKGEVLEGLGSLVDKSLVQALDADTPGGETERRFSMLETIREFALDRLLETADAAITQQRHAAHYLALAEGAEPQLVGPAQAAGLARLEREHPNLVSALGWCASTGRIPASVRLVRALSWFWTVRGYLAEGREWTSRLLALPGLARPTASRLRVLDAAAAFAFYQRDYAAARSLQVECLAISRELGDQGGVLAALSALGSAASQQCDAAAARAYFEEELALSRVMEYGPGVLNALHGLANVAYEQGEDERSRALGEQCLEVCRELQIVPAMAIQLHHLGMVAERRCDYDAANARYEESLSTRRELGDRRGVAHSLMHLGTVASAQGNLGAAHARLAESLAILRELKDEAGFALALERFAPLAAARRQPARALRLAGAAAALRELIRVPLTADSEAQLEARLAPARQAIGPEAAAAAEAAGRAMGLEQAIADALTEE
jgi:predicted ATPase/DNA-binding XRE family transcriptional regulator